MKEIALTQGQVAIVDDKDYKRLSEFKWHCHRGTDYVHRENVPMSQVVLQTSRMVDHRNGNGLDNQKANLRKCTYTQNNQNRRKAEKETSSKYKGVSFDPRRRRWEAGIQLQDAFGQRFHRQLGRFSIEEEAAETYDKAARQYFGEFAALNFPVDGERSCLEG